MSTQTAERGEQQDTLPEPDEAADQADATLPDPDAPDNVEQPQGSENTADGAPAEPVQPAEADTGDPGSAIELRTERGALALHPGQRDLDPRQMAALIAIGIDIANDPGVQPHVRPFMHMCQIRGLDPFAREAYLIGRGKGNSRKWTMQTSIDGYRKMAGGTRRFIRVKKRLWTGAEDDPRWWREVEDEDGDIIRKRVWLDFWPPELGHPGAARVVIEHYDEYGNVTATAAVADWGMYAPYSEVWEGPKGNRHKATGPDGQPIKELNEMWSKGGPHMLAKCCEALGHRMAFPNTMNGIYVHEEMHRLDQAERDRIEVERRETRQRAYQEYQAAAPKQRAIAGPQPAAQQTVQGSVDYTQPAGPLIGPEPVRVGDAVPQVVEGLRADAADDAADDAAVRHPDAVPHAAQDAADAVPQGPTDEDRAAWLRDEIEVLSDLYGQPVSVLTRRQEEALGRKYDTFTASDLWRVVAPLRRGGVQALRRQGRHDEADMYESARANEIVAPAAVLFGDRSDSETSSTDVDPASPHAYVDNQGVCAMAGCERFEDDVVHTGES